MKTTDRENLRHSPSRENYKSNSPKNVGQESDKAFSFANGAKVLSSKPSQTSNKVDMHPQYNTPNFNPPLGLGVPKYQNKNKNYCERSPEIKIIENKYPDDDSDNKNSSPRYDSQANNRNNRSPEGTPNTNPNITIEGLSKEDFHLSQVRGNSRLGDFNEGLTFPRELNNISGITEDYTLRELAGELISGRRGQPVGKLSKSVYDHHLDSSGTRALEKTDDIIENAGQLDDDNFELNDFASKRKRNTKDGH